MMLTKKKDGFATVPILGMFMVFMIILVIVFVSYQESQRICERTDDAVTVSIQSACLFDRYEYATGALSGNKIVCFYPGTDTARYRAGDDEQNMLLTKQACSFAYEQYISLLKANMPKEYVNIPADAEGGIAHYITKFKMTNIYEDTAYAYDHISKTTEIITSADGLKSTLTVEMDINIQFPLYGAKTVRFTETGKLESRIN